MAGVLGRVPESRFLGEPGDGPIEANAIGHQLELQHDFNDDWNVLIGYNFRETSLQGNSTEAELAASRQRLFVDGQSLSRQRRYRDYDATYNVLRAELAGRFDTGPVSHNLIVGADTDEFENDQVFRRFRPATNASNPSAQGANLINIFNPVYGQFPLPAVAPQTNRVETQSSDGLYIQDQIAITDHIEIRLGGRYDDYQQEIFNRANGARVLQTDSRFSPQYGMVLKISDALSLYATRGENFRPLSGTTFAGNAFEPNDSTSSEAGAKLLMRDGQLYATVSLFSVQQDNILVADPVNAGFSIAGGKAESQGFEFDIAGALTDTLDVWLSYAYVDASMRNGVLDPNFALPIRAGDRLLNIPEQTFNLQLARDFSLNNKTLQLGGGVLYVGERLGEVATTFELPGYTLARVFASYDINEALTLRAEADNLFDETYYTNSFSQLWVQPGTPQSFRVSAALKF
jgi:iron complex outermembrane receptor protein